MWQNTTSTERKSPDNITEFLCVNQIVLLLLQCLMEVLQLTSINFSYFMMYFILIFQEPCSTQCWNVE